MATRTHTTYFSGDSLEPIRREYVTLRADAESRGTYITDEAADAIGQRLDVLRIAIELLAEPVPGPFGG